MKGILEKKENDWFVRWSDLHSFVHGIHWSISPLYLDESLDRTKLKDGDIVEFEFIATEYDKDNFTPFVYAKMYNTKLMNKEEEEVSSICIDGIWTKEFKDQLKEIGFLHIGSGWYHNEYDNIRIRLWTKNEIDFHKWWSDDDNQVFFRGKILTFNEVKWVLNRCFSNKL